METLEPRSCEVTTGLKPNDWCTPPDLNREPTDSGSEAAHDRPIIVGPWAASTGNDDDKAAA